MRLPNSIESGSTGKNRVPDTRAQQWVKQGEVSPLMQLIVCPTMSTGITPPELLALLASFCAGVILRWAFSSPKSDFTGGRVLQSEGSTKIKNSTGKELGFFHNDQV